MPEANTPTKSLYAPTSEQLDTLRKDRKKVDRMYKYRSQFEPQWKRNIEKWNRIAPEGMENMPNYVVPITRMATNTGVVKMRQALPALKIIPEGKDEKKMSYLLGEASDHVHRMTNMEGVMDHAMIDYAVIGNTVLESFVKIPYKAKRVPVIDKHGVKTGKYETLHKRDWSRPKIGTRFRSIWECAFDEGARTIGDIRRCTFQDRLSEQAFEEEYVNRPDNEYINLEYVEGGQVYVFGENGDLERIEAKEHQVVVDHVQDEIEDSYRIYANGVLIWDVALSEVHQHGKVTLSLIPNHHAYDDNMKTHALYGIGDPELLEDLDDLVNAATNMFIKNMQLKNTNVVSIDGSVDVEDIDYLSGMPIKGKVSIQSLGQADLPEFEAFKTICEEWAIQSVQKNFKRLEGEVAKTAYEARQKQRQEDQGIQYQSKKMESSGLYEYYRKHVSDIMEHLTIEEWEDIADDDTKMIKDMIGEELASEDVVLKDGKPVKVRHIERIRTRGRVYKENFVKGKRSLSDLSEVNEMRGQDGWLPASGEYLHTRGWKLFKQVPDIYLIGQTMLGQDDMIELAKVEQFIQLITSVANLMASGIKLKVDFESLIRKGAEAIGIKMEEIEQEEEDEDKQRIDETIKKAHALKNALVSRSPMPAAGVVGSQAGGEAQESPGLAQPITA